MRRRGFLATAGAVALSGCTASAYPDPTERELSVDGLEESSVYHDWNAFASNALKSLLGENQATLALVFDPDAGYNPLEGTVELIHDGNVLSDGDYRGKSNQVSREFDRIGFEISRALLFGGPQFRVVSRVGDRVVDVFELAIHSVE